jgi:hypothetical protein
LRGCNCRVGPLWTRRRRGEKVDSDRIDKVEVDGASFRIHLTGGKLLQGRDLEGATLAIVLPGNPQPQRIKLVH